MIYKEQQNIEIQTLKAGFELPEQMLNDYKKQKSLFKRNSAVNQDDSTFITNGDLL